MIKVFNSRFIVTQGFGVNPNYYSQFGLSAHEGLDLIPSDSDWRIYSLPYNGIVVKDIDMEAKGGAYGVHCTIWYPSIKEAWMYCHLSSNQLKLDGLIPPSNLVGLMGATGNTQGAHLHLNRFQVDDQGKRLNRDNGYLGGIDPLPSLQSAIMQENMPINDQTKIDLGRFGNLEIQAIRGKLADLEITQKQLTETNQTLKDCQATSSNLPPETASNLSVEQLLRLLITRLFTR